MLCTSSFATSANHPGAVSIARFPPKWYRGRCFFALAPTMEMLQIGDWPEYRRRYRQEILAPLDPGAILRELHAGNEGDDIVLLCFERDRTHCHRGLVAEWFWETRGIAVPERDQAGGQQKLW